MKTETTTANCVTPLPSIATWTNYTLDQPAILSPFQQPRVNLLPQTGIVEDREFINTLTQQHTNLSANTTVVMIGTRSNNTLFRELYTLGSIRYLYETGDFVVPGIAQEAAYSGHATEKPILDSSPQLKRRKQVTLVS